MHPFVILGRFAMHDKSRLIQMSFLMLFVELTLIRWIGSNILAISFYSNFVLLASFLGIGIGFIRSKSASHFFRFSPIFLAIIVFFCYRYHYEYQISLDAATDDLNLYRPYFKENLFPIWLSLPIVFLCVTVVMMSIADGVASAFRKFPPLQAYRLEVLGSLLGVVFFSLLSFSHVGPLWWAVIINLLFISLLTKEWRKPRVLTFFQIAALILIFSILGKESGNSTTIWSPYYKIAVLPYSHDRYAINVNGLPQQFVESVEQKKVYKPFYFYPYQHMNKPASLDNVLIIGAGTGGDVAIALAEGAKQVDAVEIDPELYELGKKLNPDHPYFDPRVRVYIDDGRAFLQQNTNLYDMIVFALPDSLMIISRQSSLRLENYLFTLEGIENVKSHLKPDGVFSMYNYYRLGWIVDRLANTLKTVFNDAPCIDTEGNNNHWLTVLTISKSPSALQCPSRWQFAETRYSTPTTDDYPFLYLEEKRIPALYILTLTFILLAAHYLFKRSGVSYRSIIRHADLFLMGAAFLLLETKSVVNFALLFGSTWFVNALVFIGILLTVYLAIEATNRISVSRPFMLYTILLVTLLLAWVIPSQALLSLSFYYRFAAAVVLTFSPIFVANLIFANRFQQTIHSTEALGTNLLGAVVGGLLEYVSMIVGYRSLLIVVAILYTVAILAMVVQRRKVPSLSAS